MKRFEAEGGSTEVEHLPGFQPLSLLAIRVDRQILFGTKVPAMKGFMGNRLLANANHLPVGHHRMIFLGTTTTP